MLNHAEEVYLAKESTSKKILIAFIMLIMPRKIMMTYIVLSFMFYVAKLKKQTLDINQINLEKIKSLLDITLNEEILIVPRITCDWLWKNLFLEEVIDVGDRKISIKDFLMDDTLKLKYSHKFTDIIMRNLPFVYRMKLSLNLKRSRMNFRHTFIRNIITPA